MANADPPTNVGSLLLRVKASAANIAAHRQAMAEVAAIAKNNQPKPPAEGVTKQ